MIGTGQGDTGQGAMMPAHEVLQPWMDDDTAPGDAVPAVTRPLENGERRDVRQRTSLLSDANLKDLLDKCNGKEPWPSHVRKHISACVGDLTRKVEKSLKLANKKRALIDQANRLNEGHIPAGVKPFKVSIEEGAKETLAALLRSCCSSCQSSSCPSSSYDRCGSSGSTCS